jgi:acyl carrier protein
VPLETPAAFVSFVRGHLREVAPDVPVDEIDADTSLSELGVDSVALAAVVAAIEDELGIVLPEDELLEVDSVTALMAVAARQAR